MIRAPRRGVRSPFLYPLLCRHGAGLQQSHWGELVSGWWLLCEDALASLPCANNQRCPAVPAVPGPSLELLGTEMASQPDHRAAKGAAGRNRAAAGGGGRAKGAGTASRERCEATDGAGAACDGTATLARRQWRCSFCRAGWRRCTLHGCCSDPTAVTAAVVMAMMMTQQRRRWSRCRARWLSTKHLRGS
jgi:hypothetical protein